MIKHKLVTVGLTTLLTCSTSLAGADYTPTLGDNSVYDITRIDSAEGSDFSLVEINDDGTSSITYYQYKIKDGAQSSGQVNDDLEGKDVNNNFFGLTGDNGAAIFNRTNSLFNPEWKIGNVTGDFVNNRVDGDLTNGPQGGAIYNRPAGGGTTSIGSITGDFINNAAASDSVWPSYGGAIYNSTNALGQTASIGDITGNFIGNSATNTNNHAFGGAIYNYSYDDGISFSPATLGVISGSFIGNYVEGTGLALGGAIYTSGNLTIASKGKNIEFAGNYAVTDGNRVNNAIFMDTVTDGSTLTFDVSGGGQIWFLDQIDGGEVNGTGTGIEYDKQYSLVISGNGTTVGSGRIFFADTINNTATVTVNNAVMTMGSYDGHHGNFTQPNGGTADVTLNDGHLDLDYDGYQTLSLNSLTATGNSYLSFGANFHAGTADVLDTANLTGDYGLGSIHMDNFGNVGESVTIFANANTTLNNLDTYTGIYNNIDYKFAQNGNELSVIFKDLVRAESIVVEEEILEVADKELNNLTGGILDNSGTTTVNKGSFSGNSNDGGNGGVFTNHGNLTLTEVDFADNSSGKDGGAIYNDGSLGETLSGSNYSGNTAAGSGGAIYNAAAGTIGNIAGLSATNSFSNNTAGESGGAIYNDGSLASVTGFSFIGNRVAGGTLALGGAVYTSGSMLFDSDGKYIEFSGNSVENAAGETTNNAIFVNTADGAPVLTFDVSKGGGIVFADEIDGGAVNADRTGIDYDKQYSVVLKGNGSGKDAAEISFADTINNASALTADKINLTLTGTGGSFGNFGSKGTDLSLNDSRLNLDYAAGEYQQLTIGNLSVTGNSYLSFGANFLKGTSDSLNIAGVSGELGIYDIRFDYSGNVGDKITLFDNAAVTINNLDSFRKVYNNLGYIFTQNGTDLVITSKYIEWAGAVVLEGEILDIQETHMDANSDEYEEVGGLHGYILKNNGITTVTDSSFSNIVNDKTGEEENGGVFINNGSMTITNTDFTGNSSAGNGGAIYSTSDLTLIADNDEVVFDGNADGNGGNDIYMGSGSSTLYIIARNNGTASFGSGINGENGYQINISGDTDSSVVFTAAAENAASVTIDNTVLKMRENGSFGTGSTAVLLNDGRLELDYGTGNYKSLAVGSLTAEGDSSFAFGANFNAGTSDSLNIATASGKLDIEDIRFDNFGNVGDKITLFDNAHITLNNLEEYTQTYNNLDYKFAQNGAELEIISKDLVRAESVVEIGEILDVENKTLNNLEGGILNNAGTTTIDNSSFADNSNDNGNGGVIANSGSLTITNTDFTGNSSAGNGGAIYSTSDLTLIADNDEVVFDGNADGNGGNDIYMGSGSSTLYIIARNNGTASFGSGINGENGYQINISGDTDSSVVFTAAAENAAALDIRDTALVLKEDGSFGTGSTAVSLNNGRLELDYGADNYKSLAIDSLTATGDSLIAFGANFNAGTSDSFDIAAASGELGIYNIRFDGFGNVGDKITLFDDAAVTINNLDNYTKIYNNLDYKFAQNGAELEIISKDLVRAESVVVENEILDIQATELNNMTAGILDNAGTTLMEDSRFDGNSHDGSGSVVNNKGTLVITNSSFTNNTSAVAGGAIHNTGRLTLVAEGDDMTFAGNTDGSGANDIFMAAGTTLNIRLTEAGSLTFGSGINGESGYTINVAGDNSGTLILDSSIQNSGGINVSNAEVRLQTDNLLDGQKLALTNAALNLANGSIGTLSLSGYTARNASLWLDVDTANNVADVLNIKGELTGTTGLIVNMLSDVEQTADIVFANTPDDTDAKDGTFVISRVVGKPYQYNLSVAYNEENKQWLFPYQEYVPGPDGQINVAPEFVAYAGLMQASVEQTRGLHHVVAQKVAANKLYSNSFCGVYDEAYDGETLTNAWVTTDYRQSDGKRPLEMDADVWGVTGGFDLQANAYNKIGVFAAYRQGEYDLSGDGKKLYSSVGSKIDIDSYLGGLYYRYDRRTAYVMATAFGGTEEAEIKTDDGVAKADTDGTKFGASLEAGYLFAINKSWTLTPKIGIFYSLTDYDDIRDQTGNTASFDRSSYFEAEAGLRLEKTFHFDDGAAKFHIEPSLVQTFDDNADVLMSNLPTVSALSDQTLGRIEIGGRYGFSTSFSAFGWADYTFGSHYDAVAFGAGLSFSW